MALQTKSLLFITTVIDSLAQNPTLTTILNVLDWKWYSLKYTQETNAL